MARLDPFGLCHLRRRPAHAHADIVRTPQAAEVSESAESSTTSAITVTASASRRARASRRWEEARGLLRDREGAIKKGAPITARSTRLTFDAAVPDVVNDHTIKANVDGGTRAAHQVASESCL